MNDTAIETVITATVLAKRLGIHRATISRLEAKRVIPMARRVNRPFQGRIYNEQEAEAVTKALEKHYNVDRSRLGEAVVVTDVGSLNVIRHE